MTTVPELAPDGLARWRSSRSVLGNVDVWLLDAGRGVARSVHVRRCGRQPVPLWSPDGRQRGVSVYSRGGRYDLFREARGRGTSDEQPLMRHVAPANESPLDWSRDGRFLLYSTQDPKTASDLWALPLHGRAEAIRGGAKPLLTRFEGQFSPDGRWLAYASNESGRYEIYIRTFPKADVKRLVSAAGGVQPRWRRDGRELFYVAPDRRLTAVRCPAGGRHTSCWMPVQPWRTLS